MSTEVTTKTKTETLPAPSELGIELKSVAETRLSSPSLKNVIAINKKVATTHIYMLITSTYIKCGQIIESDKVATTTALFLEELEDYEYLTIKEINKAFKDGYKGHYGKYYGLNVLTFITWIEYYIKNVRMDELAKNRLTEPILAPLPEITESTKEEILKSGCIRLFNAYKDTGAVEPGSLYLFDFLESKSIINLTEKEISANNKRAYSKLKSEFRPSRKYSNRKNHSFKSVLKELESGDDSRLICEIQYLAISTSFKKIIKNNESIEKYL